ncbi:amino acid transporter [Penicillium angulare]|uniref:Amino acid transporter n=1 Tax=Penicillium angulare TaxID=116970 RepID=A0A9W9FXI3_9EURO|nr:amino acid transporter [Penicillium angulare]
MKETEMLKDMHTAVAGDEEPGEILQSRERHFNLWSTLGINYSAIGTPLSIGTYLSFSFALGGSPAYIYGYLVAGFMQIIVCLSLSELAAAYPHSSGQVYWTSIFAPRRYSRSLSYWTGAFTASAWFFWMCGTYLFTTQLLFATVSMARVQFTAEKYQVYLGYVAAAIVSLVLNTTLFKHYSALLRLMVILVNAGAVITMVVLLVRSSPKRTAQTVFVDFIEDSGWKSSGFAFLLGLLPGVTAINGFDSSTHVTDELPNPEKQVPQVMVGTAILAYLAGLPMTIVYMFCVVNEEALLDPVGGQPIAQLFLDSCNSLPLAVFLMVIFTFVFLIAASAMTTTSSRVFWSLANEKHLACSAWLEKLTTSRSLPINAICFTVIAGCAIGLLSFGSALALSAMLNTAAICFFISFLIPLICVVTKRDILKKRAHYMNLGSTGLALNCIAISWMLLMSVVLLFPGSLPVTTANMNYAIAVLGGVMIVFGVSVHEV